MTKKRAILLSVTILFIGLFITVGSYAFWSWSSNTNKNIVFNTSKKLSNYIVYDEGESKFVGDFQISSSYTQGIHSTISLYKTSEAANVSLTATIHMDINNIGNVMKKSTALKWKVTLGDSTNIGATLAEGNFIGVENGDTITLVPNIEVTTTLTKYTIWVWIDANENPSDDIIGETFDSDIWTEINQTPGVEDRYEVTRINANYQSVSATVVDNKHKITKYAITTSDIEPAANSSDWVTIPVADQANIYNLNTNVSATGTYYVWFMDDAGRTINAEAEVDEMNITANVNITGTATWGQMLTANASCTIPSSGCSFTYQWKANGSDISGATGSTYVIAKEQVGKTITVTIVASATNYANKTVTSAATSAVAKQDLTVTTTNYSAAYDGSEHYATIKVTSSEWTGAMIVSGTSTSYGTDVTTNGTVNTSYDLKPGYIDFTDGAKTVYYKVTGGAYYNDKTGSATVTISSKPILIYYNTNYGSVEGTSTNVGKYEADEDNWVVSTTSGNFITQTCTSNSTCNLWDYNANGWLFSKTGHLPVNGSEWISRRGNDYTNTLNQATDYTYDQMIAKAYRETDTAYEVWLYVNWTPKPILIYYNTNYGSVEGTSTNVGKYEADEDNWVVSTTSGNFITQTCTSNSTCNLWDYNANGWLFSKTGHLPVNGSEWISRRGNDYTNTLNQATDWSYNQMVGTAYRETDTAYEVWLYANWQAQSYIITANANGGAISSTTGWTGTGSTATRSVTYGSTYGTLPTTTRANYTLKGWYTAVSGGDAVTSNTTMNNVSNHSIYASWYSATASSSDYTAVSVTVTSTDTAASKIYGYKISNSSTCSQSVTGFIQSNNNTYSFNVASEVLAAGSKTYYVCVKVTSDVTTYVLSNSITVNAVYNVTYAANGGSGSMSADTVTYNSAFMTSENRFTRAGYTFNGWYDSEHDVTWTLTSPGVFESGSSWNWTYKYDVTLTAQWTLNSYYVRYHGSSTNATDVTTNYTEPWTSSAFTYEGTYTKLIENNWYSRPGYSFAGWTTLAGYNGWTEGYKGESNDGKWRWTDPNYGIGDEETHYLDLYASWTANSYTVYLNANGGSIPTTSGWTLSTNDTGWKSASKSMTYGSTYGTLPTPTLDGYSFAGWKNVYSYGDLSLTAGTSNHKYQRIYENAMPGVTYTINMTNAQRTAGTATQFETVCYDFTSVKRLAAVTTSFGSNVSYSITCPTTADKTHDLVLIIYAGVNESTAGNSVTYTGITINTTSQTDSTTYNSSTILSTPSDHELIALWTIKPIKIYYNANGGTLAGTGNYVGKYTVDSNGWATYVSNSNYIIQTCNSGANCNLWDYNGDGWLFSKSGGYVATPSAEWIARKGNSYTTTLNQATTYTYAQLVSNAYRETDDAYEVWLYVNWTVLPSCATSSLCTINDEGNGNWTLTIKGNTTVTLPKAVTIDYFLVGGGGGGGTSVLTSGNYYGGGGGGGITTSTAGVSKAAGTYSVTIGSGGSSGANGGTTSGFGYTASGGKAGGQISCNESITQCSRAPGGATGGGSNSSGTGGAGAFYISNTNSEGAGNGGNGVRAFGASSGTMYGAGGGGGGAGNDSGGTYYYIGGTFGGFGGTTGGGTGCGANGQGTNSGNPSAATNYTGSGGGGAGVWCGARNGGSGVIIIRTHR